MARTGGRKDSEWRTHKCEMISGEGNGKPLLNSNFCLENPLQDHQESQQTRRTNTVQYNTQCVSMCGFLLIWRRCIKVCAVQQVLGTHEEQVRIATV